MSAIVTLMAALLNIYMGRFAGVSPWLTAMAALVLSTISVLAFIFEFILYVELVDPLFRKRQSVNVIGTLRRPGTKNVNRLLILSSHHDSALESTWVGLLGYGFYFPAATLFIGFIAMLTMSAIQLAGVITGNAGTVRAGTLGWAMLAYPMVPSVIFAMFFNRGKEKRRHRAGRSR